jgi:hypothetical protein
MVGGIGLMVFTIITLTYIGGLDGFMHVLILASVAKANLDVHGSLAATLTYEYSSITK